MGLFLNYTPKVREALKSPRGLGVDLLVLASVAGLIAALAVVFGQVSAPMRPKVDIDLSLWSLPKYTLLSLCRGFAAYGLSLIFTLVYGTIAAHNHRAEKVMIPALDVLQAIPVLSFLPGLVLALVHLFPTREIGLELACVIMIFTAQVWNMTFSFHGSLRGIPTALREAAVMQRFTGWQIFRILEVPASLIGLVWNSMMSMAGGWFFLTVNEAFQLNNQDFRLKGIGSYMSEAIDQGNTRAMLAAIVAMTIMIVGVDQLFWRPIVVWTQRFKLEDSAEADAPHSWVVNLFQYSLLLRRLGRLLHRRGGHLAPAAMPEQTTPLISEAARARIRTAAGWLTVCALSGFALWGAYRLVELLASLPLHDRVTDGVIKQGWTSVLLALLASFTRTTTAVVLGAAWTLPVGIVIGLSTRWSHRLQPVIQVLASFPAPMLFPLVFFLLVRLGIPFNIGCVALMLLGSQWYILFNVIAGATAIPAALKEAAEIYHMSDYRRWTELYLPSVFPYLVTGLITAAGGAWNATIVSEYLKIGDNKHIAFGLGSMISQATDGGEYALLAAATLAMAVSVVILNRLIWKRLFRLAESRYSLNT